MGTQVSLTLSDEIYKHIDYLARLSNQNTADVISNIINGAFQPINQKLNTPTIAVAVSNDQTKPIFLLTLSDAMSTYLDDLLRPGSQTTTPELILIFIPQDKNVLDLLCGTVIQNLSQFSVRLRAEKLVSGLSDSELLALIDGKGQTLVSDPMEEQQIGLMWGTNPSEVMALQRDFQENITRLNVAKNEAYRRGLIKFSDWFL